MLKKILQELVLIRKELQAIRSDLELCHSITINGNAKNWFRNNSEPEENYLPLSKSHTAE